MNRERRAANALITFLSLICLVLLSLPLSGKVRAFRALASYLLLPGPYLGGRAIEKIASLPADVGRVLSVDMENRRLRDDNRQTELLREEAAALRRENERLAAALSLQASVPEPVCWARVFERDPLNWQRSLLIGAGAASGVELNSPVLAVSGGRLAVLGRVIEVADRTAKVLLLRDELSAVTAYVPSGQWEGLVQGQGHHPARMNYLPLEARLQAGDEVLTSATSAAFPPDLPIGYVSRVFEREPSMAFQHVEVTPFLDGSTVKEVLVLRRKRRAAG